MGSGSMAILFFEIKKKVKFFALILKWNTVIYRQVHFLQTLLII